MSSAIDQNTSMQELLQVYPGAQRALFRKYHIGGCASCGFRPDETLGEVCARNDNLSVQEVISYIEASHQEDVRMQVEPKQLKAELENGGDLRLIDIRTREEFEAARIEGSVLFTQELMQEMLGTWGRDAQIIFIDHQGRRSMDAAAYFIGHGFTNVRSMKGGIDAWSQEVDPSVPRYHLE